MVSVHTRTVLLGRDERRTKQWGVVSLALALASLVYFAGVKTVDEPTVHLLLWWEGYAALLVCLVAVQAYTNGGVALSWLLVFGAAGGVVANYGGVGLTETPGVLSVAVLTILGGSVAAAVLGTLGFGLGTVARRVGG